MFECDEWVAEERITPVNELAVACTLQNIPEIKITVQDTIWDWHTRRIVTHPPQDLEYFSKTRDVDTWHAHGRLQSHCHFEKIEEFAAVRCENIRSVVRDACLKKLPLPCHRADLQSGQRSHSRLKKT
nr:hypothetical protein [Granulicella paludicola]